MRKKSGHQVVRTIFVCTLAVMLLLTASVFSVSVQKVHWRSGTDLSKYAQKANLVSTTTKALRGNIYANDGTVIAEDNRTYNIYCVLDENRPALKDEIAYVKDKEETAKTLARILHADPDKILEYLSQNVYQTELGTAGRNLSESTKKEIEETGLPGIEFTDSIRRVYPLGTFASNLIGFAQSDESGSTVGKMGTELYLNSYLSGEDGYRIYQADRNGYILPGMKDDSRSATNGYNVYTTLDQEIQEAMEESFLLTESRFHATRIWAAVMDVHTGRILGWGQYPSFDPNTLDITDYNNYGAQIPYEPGSTLKTFTWAAAINEGVYNGTDEVYSGPYYFESDANNNPVRVEYSSMVINNAHNTNYGWIDYDHGLMYSSNVVAAEIQNGLITPQIHLDYLKKFGFFHSVNSDGMPEETGYLNFTWPADRVSLSYGQGSTVTMLQMLQAYSAIFAEGDMVRPYYIESIRDPYDSTKVIYQAKTKVTGSPITQETAETVQEILYRTVNDEDGTAKYYQIPECKIMGKTGTTQVAINGSYLSGYTITSFMSALPAEDPQVLVYYCFEAPYDRNAHYYTEATQNLLRKTAMRLGFAQIGVNGETEEVEGGEEVEEEVVKEAGSMPDLVNHSVAYAEDKLAGLDVTPIYLGNGITIVDQVPLVGSSVEGGQHVFLLTDTNSFVMPDMTGWTRKDVTALWQVTQFAFTLKGEGVVSSQSVPAGSTVSRGTTIEVEFN